MSVRAGILLAAGVMAVGVGAIVQAAEPEVTVRPGTVVRWTGSGTSDCGMEESHWPAIRGTCWYPIDLTATGSIVVTRTREGRQEHAVVNVGEYPYPEQRLEVDDSKVHLAPEDAERAARESRQVAALWAAAEGPAQFTLPLAPPLHQLPAGGRFGARRVFNGEPRSPHSGADYPAGTGTQVFAAADGEVVLAADLFFSGRSVFVDHGGGLVTMYFHLSRMDVKEGERVRRGQKLGEVGATGRVTGPHLHFGARWHGARVDPSVLLGDPSLAPDLER